MSRVTMEHIEARKRAILAAAQTVFARKGIQAATMAEIAELAGLSAGAIYRYYDSKEALAASCMGEGVEAMTAEWRTLVEHAADPFEAFVTIAEGAFAELEQEGAEDISRIMLEEALASSRGYDPSVTEAARRARGTVVRGLQDALQRAQDAGQLPADLDAYQLAQALLSFYYGARMARLVDPSVDTHRQLREMVKLMDHARRAC
jgi:AcrR family transcriptional regulator